MSTKLKDIKKWCEKEIHENLPVAILSDKSISYKNYRIKQNKIYWELTKKNSDIVIEKFNTKTSALLAAKFYDSYNYNKLVDIKNLDRKYYYNLIDIEIYKDKLKRTKNLERRDILINRKELSEQKIALYKLEIANHFKNEF